MVQHVPLAGRLLAKAVSMASEEAAAVVSKPLADAVMHMHMHMHMHSMHG
jgi:hypothetical protein